MDQAPVASLLFLPDDCMTLVWRNAAHERLSGSVGVDVIGKGLFEAFPPSVEEGGSAAMSAIGEAVAQICATRQAVDIGPYRYDLKNDDGRYAVHHWQMQMSPVVVDGEVAAILQMSQDVTAAVLERELADTLQRAAVSTAAVAHFSYDPVTDDFSRSQAIDEMFGFAPGTAGDKAAPFFAKVHPDDLPGVHAEVERVLAAERGTIASFDYRVPMEDGSERFIRIRAEIALDPADRTEKLVGTFIDLTDVERNRLALEREVAHREALAQEANHRIKNSLAIALAVLRMERRAAEEAGKDGMSVAPSDVIARLESRLSAISSAHGLMAMSEDGIDVSLHALVAALARQARQTAGLSEDALRARVEGPDAMLDSDRATSLAMILNELLTNALKYGLSAEGRADIEFAAITDAAQVTFVLRNAVVPAGDIAIIPSTRLGSRLVAKLRDDLGATIESESEDDVFTVRLEMPL